MDFFQLRVPVGHSTVNIHLLSSFTQMEHDKQPSCAFQYALGIPSGYPCLWSAVCDLRDVFLALAHLLP